MCYNGGEKFAIGVGLYDDEPNSTETKSSPNRKAKTNRRKKIQFTEKSAKCRKNSTLPFAKRQLEV